MNRWEHGGGGGSIRPECIIGGDFNVELREEHYPHVGCAVANSGDGDAFSTNRSNLLLEWLIGHPLID